MPLITPVIAANVAVVQLRRPPAGEAKNMEKLISLLKKSTLQFITLS